MHNKLKLIYLTTFFSLFAASTAVACDSKEITLLVSFTAKEGQEKAVEGIMLELAGKANAEPGVTFYAPYWDAASNTYYLLERYTETDAHKAHVQNADFQRLFPKLKELLASPIKGVKLDPVCNH